MTCTYRKRPAHKALSHCKGKETPGRKGSGQQASTTRLPGGHHSKEQGIYPRGHLWRDGLQEEAVAPARGKNGHKDRLVLGSNKLRQWWRCGKDEQQEG